MGLDIRIRYDPDRVMKTKDGWAIHMWAHT